MSVLVHSILQRQQPRSAGSSRLKLKLPHARVELTASLLRLSEFAAAIKHRAILCFLFQIHCLQKHVLHRLLSSTALRRFSFALFVRVAALWRAPTLVDQEQEDKGM